MGLVLDTVYSPQRSKLLDKNDHSPNIRESEGRDSKKSLTGALMRAVKLSMTPAEIISGEMSLREPKRAPLVDDHRLIWVPCTKGDLFIRSRDPSTREE